MSVTLKLNCINYTIKNKKQNLKNKINISLIKNVKKYIKINNNKLLFRKV